jgi:hypothetical protein
MPLAAKLYTLSETSGPNLRPTQPPIQRLSGAVSLGVNQPGRDANHEASSCSEVKIGSIYTSSSHIHVFMVRKKKIAKLLIYLLAE